MQASESIYIFVTHEHYDHCDAKAIRQLEKPTTTIITNANSVRIIGKGKIMHNGDHLQYHPKGRDNGYILTLDGFRIYISGDTEDIPEMKNIKNIDVAFLSTNQPFTMTPAQTANAAKTIKPKVLFLYHYSDTDVSKVKDRHSISRTHLPWHQLQCFLTERSQGETHQTEVHLAPWYAIS